MLSIGQASSEHIESRHVCRDCADAATKVMLGETEIVVNFQMRARSRSLVPAGIPASLPSNEPTRVKLALLTPLESNSYAGYTSTIQLVFSKLLTYTVLGPNLRPPPDDGA
jgi:hypothetical protein